MKFKIGQNGFTLDGKDFFLHSGEIHYFRIEAGKWRKHLTALKEAGGNTVSTYVSWDWHEFEEGKFDFTGLTNPQRNLKRFIEEAAALGLKVIVKPGPYILAEYFYGGIPVWLPKKHPEILSLSEEGKVQSPFVVTYLHPVFLEYVSKWYEKIMPFFKKYQIDADGPIVMMQVCNEIGLFQWLGGQADYNPVNKKYWQEFLQERYAGIEKLNQIHRTNYKKFEEIEIQPSIVGNKTEFAISRDWHDFWRWYWAKYLRLLIDKIRAHGITMQLSHNVAGWVYGQALEFPLYITLYKEMAKLYPDICFGLDHIPENLSYRNFHYDWAINQMVSSLQGGGPVWSAEFQSGTRESSVRTYPNEMELFYKLSLAHNLKGLNYYCFSSGRNPEGRAGTGPNFYWETPLDPDGKKGPVYPVVKRFGRFIDTHGRNLINTNHGASVCVGFYIPYFETELVESRFVRPTRWNLKKLGLKYDVIGTRESVFFDGVIKFLTWNNYNYAIESLQDTPVEKLLQYKQLWIVSLEYMDQKTQEKLWHYVQGGGQLIIMPVLPEYDLYLSPCRWLQEKLGVEEKTGFESKIGRFNLLGLKDITCLPYINLYGIKDAKVIAETTEGKPCGWIKKTGKGEAIILGTCFGHQVEEHFQAYQKLLDAGKILRHASSENQDITLTQTFGNGYGYLLVANIHRTQLGGKITYTEPSSGKKVTFPDKGSLNIPPTYAWITPLDLELTKDVCLSYTTSDLLSWKMKSGKLLIEIYGDKDLEGEAALKFSGKIKEAKIGKERIIFRRKGNRYILNYKHKNKPEMISIKVQ